jgi:RimJ/RimL family protein N-acetyltransferase
VPGSVTPQPNLPTSADLQGRFTGELVVVEPLAAEHERGLIAAADQPELFRWMPIDMASSDDAVRAWLSESLDHAASGREVPFAILDAASGRVLGSTRFLELRLEHLRVEIGWTWLTRPAWGTGANVETKLLLLEHAFERVGCRRVEFKTDARNERSRGALLALGRCSRACCASTWSCAAAVRETRRTSQSSTTSGRSSSSASSADATSTWPGATQINRSRKRRVADAGDDSLRLRCQACSPER